MEIQADLVKGRLGDVQEQGAEESAGRETEKPTTYSASRLGLVASDEPDQPPPPPPKQEPPRAAPQPQPQPAPQPAHGTWEKLKRWKPFKKKTFKLPMDVAVRLQTRSVYTHQYQYVLVTEAIRQYLDGTTAPPAEHAPPHALPPDPEDAREEDIAGIMDAPGAAESGAGGLLLALFLAPFRGLWQWLKLAASWLHPGSRS
jgi:hypothetical protein